MGDQRSCTVSDAQCHRRVAVAAACGVQSARHLNIIRKSRAQRKRITVRKHSFKNAVILQCSGQTAIRVTDTHQHCGICHRAAHYSKAKLQISCGDAATALWLNGQDRGGLGICKIKDALALSPKAWRRGCHTCCHPTLLRGARIRRNQHRAGAADIHIPFVQRNTENRAFGRCAARHDMIRVGLEGITRQQKALFPVHGDRKGKRRKLGNIAALVGEFTCHILTKIGMGISRKKADRRKRATIQQLLAARDSQRIASCGRAVHLKQQIKIIQIHRVRGGVMQLDIAARLATEGRDLGDRKRRHRGQVEKRYGIGLAFRIAAKEGIVKLAAYEIACGNSCAVQRKAILRRKTVGWQHTHACRGAALAAQ